MPHELAPVNRLRREDVCCREQNYFLTTELLNKPGHYYMYMFLETASATET